MQGTNRLTAVTVKAAKPKENPYKLSDGGGLYLLVMPNGRRYWRLKYRFAGKERLLAFGAYPEVPLQSAREQRDEARRLIREKSVDPVQHRKEAKATRIAAASNTFELLARAWHSKEASAWSKGHADVILRRLEKDVFPYIGSTSVSILNFDVLLAVLRRVEQRGAIETAHRIRQYIDAILRYGVRMHLLSANPTPHPEVLSAKTVGKFAAITDVRGVGDLMRAIRGYGGSQVTRMALQLAPYVFVRPGELRTAEWTEFDLSVGEWRIPAAKTKMRRDHIVPLSRQAVEILMEVRLVTGQRTFVFPSERGHKRCMSENTLLAALRVLGFTKEQMTPHGFRHMASTLLHESQKYRSEVIERQLAHVDKNSIRRIYNAAEYLPERREMMQWWADYLDRLASSENVISFRGRA